MSFFFEINPQYWRYSALASHNVTTSSSLSSKCIILDPDLQDWLNSHGTENKDWYVSHHYRKDERLGSISSVSIMMKNKFDEIDKIEFKMKWV